MTYKRQNTLRSLKLLGKFSSVSGRVKRCRNNCFNTIMPMTRWQGNMKDKTAVIHEDFMLSRLYNCNKSLKYKTFHTAHSCINLSLNVQVFWLDSFTVLLRCVSWWVSVLNPLQWMANTVQALPIPWLYFVWYDRAIVLFFKRYPF